MYSPGLVLPGRIDAIASQIDVGPTVLGILNFSYPSRFFGHDIRREGAQRQRAFFANYQTVGYYRDGRVVELKPKARYSIVDAENGQPQAEDALTAQLLDEAISYYQSASEAYRSGDLKLVRPPR